MRKESKIPWTSWWFGSRVIWLHTLCSIDPISPAFHHKWFPVKITSEASDEYLRWQLRWTLMKKNRIKNLLIEKKNFFVRRQKRCYSKGRDFHVHLLWTETNLSCPDSGQRLCIGTPLFWTVILSTRVGAGRGYQDLLNKKICTGRGQTIR